MLEKIVYVLMALEALQHSNFIDAYLCAAGGGIVRSALMNVWSSNLSFETIFSILFWNAMATVVQKHNLFLHIREKVTPFKFMLDAFSTIVFGVYGFWAAPALGGCAYALTAFGGGSIMRGLRSSNILCTSLDELNKNCWTIIEGLLISICASRASQIVIAGCFFIVRIAYHYMGGISLREYANELKIYSLPTNLGIPNYLRCLCQNYQRFNGYGDTTIRRKVVFGSLCRRRQIRLS